MGAADVRLIVRGGNKLHVKRQVEKAYEHAKYESGHGGYTGTWAEWNGRIDFHSKIFPSYHDAMEYLFGYESGNCTCEKWNDAIAVEFRNNEGQLNWLVGAVVSS